MVLTQPDASLAEVIARQLPRIEAAGVTELRVILGTRDLLDGYDESYIHARLVELLDSVTLVVPDARVVVHGFPPVASHLETVRQACDAAGETTATLRGMSWVH
jgi:hypothetical protein